MDVLTGLLVLCGLLVFLLFVRVWFHIPASAITELCFIDLWGITNKDTLEKLEIVLNATNSFSIEAHRYCEQLSINAGRPGEVPISAIVIIIEHNGKMFYEFAEDNKLELTEQQCLVLSAMQLWAEGFFAKETIDIVIEYMNKQQQGDNHE